MASTAASSAAAASRPDDQGVLVAAPQGEQIVPVQQSEALHAALEAAGVDSTMVVLPGAGHGTPEEMFTSQEEKDRVVAFLERHLKRETAGAARL